MGTAADKSNLPIRHLICHTLKAIGAWAMPELLENHWGFDAAQLGFPSIAACRAVVLQTPAGLFGYHMSSGHTAAAARAQDFATWLHAHGSWVAGSGLYLYCVTYTEQPVTGYGVNSLGEWKAEAQAFATALGFGGRRMGYSLSPAHGAHSSYVRVDQAVGMAAISVAPWDDHAAYITRGSQAPTVNHGWRGQQIAKPIVTAVAMPSPPLKRINLQALD